MKTIKEKMILDLYESHWKTRENYVCICLCVRASEQERGKEKQNAA